MILGKNAAGTLHCASWLSSWGKGVTSPPYPHTQQFCLRKSESTTGITDSKHSVCEATFKLYLRQHIREVFNNSLIIRRARGNSSIPSFDILHIGQSGSEYIQCQNNCGLYQFTIYSSGFSPNLQGTLFNKMRLNSRSCFYLYLTPGGRLESFGNMYVSYKTIAMSNFKRKQNLLHLATSRENCHLTFYFFHRHVLIINLLWTGYKCVTIDLSCLFLFHLGHFLRIHLNFKQEDILSMSKIHQLIQGHSFQIPRIKKIQNQTFLMYSFFVNVKSFSGACPVTKCRQTLMSLSLTALTSGGWGLTSEFKDLSPFAHCNPLP